MDLKGQYNKHGGDIMSSIKTYTGVMFDPAGETGAAPISNRMSEKEFFDCLVKLLRQGGSYAF